MTEQIPNQVTNTVIVKSRHGLGCLGWIGLLTVGIVLLSICGAVVGQ